MDSEVQESSINKILTLLHEYKAVFPKSSNFSYTVDQSDSYNAINSINGPVAEYAMVREPTITLRVEGLLNHYFAKFDRSALVLMRQTKSLNYRSNTSMTESCEYLVGMPEKFIEEFNRVFAWSKYSKEFDELMEEELSKKRV